MRKETDMKLQILIPQYRETDEIIKPLLDSIALQQNVPFDEIGAIICNDGSDVFLSDGLLESYPFAVEYHKEPHQGVSATRNACLDYATADYVMFCDADDLFYNACGLWIIFQEMRTGFDSLISVFIEETGFREPARSPTSTMSRTAPSSTARCIGGNTSSGRASAGTTR